MQQSQFKTSQEYKQYRAEWRKAYKTVAEEIKKLKQTIKINGQEHNEAFQARLQTLRAQARAMMISVESVRVTYLIQKVQAAQDEVNRSRVNYETYVINATKPAKKVYRNKIKPSEDIIQARRDAKKNKKAELLTA